MAEIPQLQLHIVGPDMETAVSLQAGATLIGRQDGADIRLNHPRVLSRHARIDLTPRGAQITELVGARVVLNGREIPTDVPSTLHAGDRLEIGPYLLLLEAIQAETAVVEALPILSEDDEHMRVLEAEAAEEETADLMAATNLPAAAILPESIIAGPPPKPDYSRQPIPGLERHSIRFLNYLPHIYQDEDFLSRMLAIFEAVWYPIEWNVNHFGMFLDPSTSPAEFLDWMGRWFGVHFDDTWPEEKRRAFLKEAHWIFARRGTKWALIRLLEIYTGRTPEIDDETGEPFTFTVKMAQRERDLRPLLVGIRQIIEDNKPVHTAYRLEFGRRANIDDIIGRI